MSILGDLKVIISADDTDFAGKVDAVSKKIENMSARLKKVGSEMTKFVTAPLVGLGAASLKFSADSSRSFEVFGKRVQAVLGVLGNEIAKSINLPKFLDTIVAWLAKAVQWFQGLDDGTKRTIVALAAFAAAVGPVLVVLGSFVGAIATIVGALGLGIGGGLIAAIVAVGAALAFAVGDWDKFKAAVDKTKDSIHSAMGALDEWLAKKQEDDSGDDTLERDFGRRKFGGIADPSNPANGMGKVGSGTGAFGDQEEIFGQTSKQIDRITEKEKTAKEAILETVEAWMKEREALLRRNDAEDEAHKSMSTLQQKLNEIENSAQVLGIQFDRLGEAEKAVGQELIHQMTLADDGSKEAAENVKKLSELYRSLHQTVQDNAGVFNEFAKNIARVVPIAKQVADLMMSTIHEFASGVGNAVAQTIVYGQSLSKGLQQVLKQVAASIISTLIQIAVEWLILKALGLVILQENASGNVSNAVGQAGAYAVAGAFRDLGLIAGAAAAPAAASEAIATAAGAAIAGAAVGRGIGSGIAVGGAATGGIFTQPSITAIAEKGRPEIVLNQDNIERFGLNARGGNQVIQVYLSDRVIAEAAASGMPDVLRVYGVRI